MGAFHSYTFAGAILILLPAGNLLAAESSSPSDVAPAVQAPANAAAPASPEAAAPAATEPEKPATTEAGKAVAPAGLTGACEPCVDPVDDFIVRAGWWGLARSGSPTKVGEYQGLDSSSPFWDFDGLFSNGVRTVDVTITGPESQDTMAALRYYGGPGLSVSAGYERFPHRLDHAPLLGFLDTPVSSPFFNLYQKQDLNAGQDYAIRVQEFKTNFKGELADGLKWRLNLWGIEKEGERQARALQHCFNTGLPSPRNRSCHLTSQSQRINWSTFEVEPVIEAYLLDGLTVEYSRTMRTFEQADQLVLANYNQGVGGYTNPDGSHTAGYAFVPESITEIDRFKIRAELGPETDLYTLGYVGNTKNEFRKMNRHFGGVDGRLTNESIDGLTLTGYGKIYSENTQFPPFALDSVYDPAIVHEPTTADIAQPVNRDFTAFGMRARWRPFRYDYGTWQNGFALVGGYEYGEIRRKNVTFQTNVDDPDITFTQPNTRHNMFTVGAEENWSRNFSSYLRYKFIDTRYPLFGLTPTTEVSLDAALNTGLPTHEDLIEIGSTWTVTDGFMVSGTFFIENTYNHGPFANFEEDRYPYTITSWYAVNDAWALSAGYANLTDWITQDITLGDGSETGLGSFTAPWSYDGKSDVFNIGSAYAWSDRLTLTQGFEYVRGLDVIMNTPTPPGAISYNNPPAPFAPLGSYSRVSVQTFRISVGADYCWRPGISTYFRYNYYDYDDRSSPFVAGQAHMFLGGISAIF